VPGERKGDRLVLSREATHGVPIELCERQERARLALAGSDEAAAISTLDHIVVRTANPERAIAFYADGSGSIFAGPQQSRLGFAACCSSAAAILWSRSRTTSGRACRTGPIICGAELAHARHRPGERAPQGGWYRRVGTARRQAPGSQVFTVKNPHRRRAHSRDRRHRALVELAMRRIILVLVLLGTPARRRQSLRQKRSRAAAACPCPASSWTPRRRRDSEPQDIDGAAGGREWARYGRQVITYSAEARPRTEQLGVKEREAPQRIQDYWASVGHPSAAASTT